jgi:hypothetical protein
MPRNGARRRAATFVLLAAVAGSAGSALSVACGSFGSADSSAPTPEGGSVTPGGEGGAIGDGGPVCEPGAFCDSFDDDAALPRGWSVSKQQGAASLALVPGIGLNGSGALLATVVNDNNPQSARLQFEVPNSNLVAYDAVIAFSANVSIVADGVVLGPRFVTVGPGGTSRGLSVTFKKGIVRLDPDTCDAGDCILQKDEIPVLPGWHRYVLTLAVRTIAGAGGSTYELDIDGNQALRKPLPLLLQRPSSYGLGFGVTYSGGTAAGTIAFDDASFLVTSR